MADIKPLAAIGEKWTRVTPGRQADFESGVAAPTKDWETQAAAAEGAYEGGVSAAVGRKAYGRGVRAAGTAKWKSKTLAVKGRWGEGVRLGGDDFQSGFGPYHAVIERTTLPPVYPKGDPRNLERVAAIATALHRAKVGGS